MSKSVCERCGVYEAFANMTDLCCLAQGLGRCRNFVEIPRDQTDTGLSLRFFDDKEKTPGTSKAAGAGSKKGCPDAVQDVSPSRGHSQRQRGDPKADGHSQRQRDNPQ